MALSNEAVAARKGLCSRKKCIIAIEAVLVACFFTLGIDIDKNTYGFWAFESIGKNEILISSSVIIGIFWCLQKAEKLVYNKSRIVETGLQILLSVFFTVFSLLSKYFEYDTDYGMGILTDSLSSKLSVCLAFVGGMLFFMHVFRLIWNACGSIKENEYDGECWLSRFFGNHLFRNCVVLVFLAWLPFYIIRFPGCMTYVPYKIGKLQIQGFSEPTTPKNKITELSHYAEGRPVKTTGGLFAWKAWKEAKIF